MKKLLICMNKLLNWLRHLLSYIIKVNINSSNSLTNSLYNINRCEEAIEMYDYALKFDPKHADAYNNKGLL